MYLWKCAAPYPFTFSTLQTLLAHGVNLLDVVHLVTLHPASCPAGKGEDTEMNRGGKRDDNYESHPYDDIEVEDDGDDKQMLCF